MQGNAVPLFVFHQSLAYPAEISEMYPYRSISKLRLVTADSVVILVFEEANEPYQVDLLACFSFS